MTMITPDHARAHESAAADHKAHGRFAHAQQSYRLAARCWAEIADRLAHHGETAIAAMFRQEQDRNARRANYALWEAIEAAEAEAD